MKGTCEVCCTIEVELQEKRGNMSFSCFYSYSSLTTLLSFLYKCWNTLCRLEHIFLQWYPEIREKLETYQAYVGTIVSTLLPLMEIRNFQMRSMLQIEFACIL